MIKRIILYFLLSTLFWGCRKDGINPLNSTFFMRFYGESAFDGVYDIKQTPDGGYILVGFTQPEVANINSRNAYILKLNAYGNKEWHKIMGGTSFDEAKSVIIHDNTYVIGGTFTDTIASIGREMYFIKLGQNGNIILEKKLGGTEQQECNAIEVLRSGHYVLAGSSTKASIAGTNPAGRKDYSIFRVSSDGETIIHEYQHGYNGDDELTSISVIKDYATNEYIYGIGAAQFNNTGGFTVQDNIGLVPIDTKDDKLEHSDNRIYGTSGNDVGIKTVLHNQQLLVLGNLNNESDVYVNKFNDLNRLDTPDPNFNFTFDETGILSSFGACKSSSGGYVITGSLQGGEKTEGKDLIIIKIDDEGAIEWFTTYGGEGDETGISVIETSDGGYAIAGIASLGGNQDIMLLKVTSTGELN
jgi:hypothetical protein